MSTLLFQGQCGNHLELDFDLLEAFSDEVSFTESLIDCSLKKMSLILIAISCSWIIIKPLPF